MYFCNFQFVKPLIAKGTLAPAGSIRSIPITDTTVSSYSQAVGRANREQALLSLEYSYIDYKFLGRPDLTVGVGRTFNADGNSPLLLRESSLHVTKSEDTIGYEAYGKAWRQAS